MGCRVLKVPTTKQVIIDKGAVRRAQEQEDQLHSSTLLTHTRASAEVQHHLQTKEASQALALRLLQKKAQAAEQKQKAIGTFSVEGVGCGLCG